MAKSSQFGRDRATATSSVRDIRGDIYKSAYKRARRAIVSGFYLEAIVLIESLIADRLESVLAALSDAPVKVRTAGQAARDVRKYGDVMDEGLLAEVSAWSHGRHQWVHEFAKVTVQDHLAWRGRLSDARDIALAGFDLATRVTEASRRSHRQLSRRT